MEQEKKYFASWWFFVFALLILSIPIIMGFNYLGLIGGTIVERKVFENSYQRSESLKSEIGTYQATLSEISRKLSGELDPQTRVNLESQASSIRIMLTVAKGK